MKLTENAIGPKQLPGAPAADLKPLLDRLGRIEHKMLQLDEPREKTQPQPPQYDPKVIQVIVGAVEKHLEQHAAHVQKRIDGLQASILAAAQASVATRITREADVLRAQVAAMHREFASSVAQAVAEQVAERTASLQATMQAHIEAAVAPLRREILELRRRLAETDHTMGEFVSAISDTVRTATDRNWLSEEPRAYQAPPSAPVSVAPSHARAGQKPQHLDLRVIRRRLSEVDNPRPDFGPGPSPLPAAAQRRSPAAVWQFRAAS